MDLSVAAQFVRGDIFDASFIYYSGGYLAGGYKVPKQLRAPWVNFIVVGSHGIPFTDKRQHTPPRYFTQAKYFSIKCLRIFFRCVMICPVANEPNNSHDKDQHMSIENAILELAAAIRYAADKTAGGTGRIANLLDAVTCGGNAMMVTSSGDTIEQDVTQVETDAKAAQQKAMEKVSTGKQEIADALANAKAEKESKVATEQLNEALGAVRELEKSVAALEAAPLDYAKDIQPILTKVGKNRDQLVALLAKFGAKKGADIKAEDYAAIFAESNAILAARG